MSQAAYHFDSLRFVHDLEGAGVKRRHAEAEAKALSNIFVHHLKHMASKADLYTCEMHLSNKIQRVHQHAVSMHTLTQHQISDLRKDMHAGFAQIDARFSKIDERFSKMDERFSKMDERFSKIDERFSKIDARFTEIETKFQALCTGVESLGLKLTIRLGGMMCAGFGVLSYFSHLH